MTPTSLTMEQWRSKRIGRLLTNCFFIKKSSKDWYWLDNMTNEMDADIHNVVLFLNAILLPNKPTNMKMGTMSLVIKSYTTLAKAN